MDDVSERGDGNDSIFGDGGSELSSVVYDKAVHYIDWCVLTACGISACLIPHF